MNALRSRLMMQRGSRQVQSIEDTLLKKKINILVMNFDCALLASNEDDIWYVDSGASSHMTGKKEFFDSLEESTNG